MLECRTQWITIAPWQSDAAPIQPHPLAFRFDFNLTNSHGVIEIAASSSYVLWVNGHRVVEGLARSQPEDRFLDRIEADEWLRSGRNSLAVLLLPPTGVTGYSCPTRNGLFCRVHMEDGVLGSSRAWRAQLATWISSRQQLLSLAAGPQEHWDLTCEPSGWMVGAVETWSAARELGPEGTPPWRHLRPRPVAFPERQPMTPPLMWSGVDDRLAAVGGNPALSLAERVVTPVEVDGSLINTEANIFVFDLGRTRFFLPGVRVIRAAADTVLEWYYDTDFKDRPSVMRGFGTEIEGNCDTVKVSEAGSSWQSLRARGGRFVTLRIAGKEPCEVQMDIAAMEYPLPQARPLETDIGWLARAWEISAATLRSCCTDGIVDTCARENALWTFDACVAGKAVYHTFGDRQLWRHCLWLIGRGIDEWGIPSAIVPTSASFMVIFDQAFRWVISCEEYVRLTGDESLIGEVADPMGRLLEAAEDALTVDDLFVPPGYAWHWVDWAPLDRRAYSLPVNAVLLLAVRAANALSPDFGPITLRMATRLAPALARFREDDGLYRDHVAAPEGIDMGNDFLTTPPEECLRRSFHGNALMASVLLGTERQAVVNRLSEWLGKDGDPALKFGPGWLQILLQPLVEGGHGTVVLEYLRACYGAAVEAGVPTWGEGFPFTVHNSAHAWGATLNSLIAETGLGLRET